MSDLIIPKTSLETMKRVLLAYYLAFSEDGKTIQDVAKISGYIEVQINKSNKFLLELGLIIKIDNRFRLSDTGKDYIENVRLDKLEEAESILSGLIREYSNIKLVTNYVEIYKEVTIDDLRKRIESISSSNLKTADHRTGINCLIDILIEAGILERDDDKIKIKNLLD